MCDKNLILQCNFNTGESGRILYIKLRVFYTLFVHVFKIKSNMINIILYFMEKFQAENIDWISVCEISSYTIRYI